jgi:hypothetical protein
MKRKAIYSIFVLSLFILFGCMRAHDSKQAKSFPIQNHPPGISSASLQAKDVEAFSATVRPIHGEIQAKYDLAKYFQRYHKHRIAIEALKEIIEMDPTRAEAYHLMGFSLDRLGEYESAQQSYLKAIALDPAMAHAYNNLGYSYILDKKYAAAIEALKKAVALNAKNEKFHKNLGLAYFLAGMEDLADDAFNQIEDTEKADKIRVSLGMSFGTEKKVNREVQDSTEPVVAIPVAQKESVPFEKPTADQNNPPHQEMEAQPFKIIKVSYDTLVPVVETPKPLKEYKPDPVAEVAPAVANEHKPDPVVEAALAVPNENEPAPVLEAAPAVFNEHKPEPVVEAALAVPNEQKPEPVIEAAPAVPVEKINPQGVRIEVSNGNGVTRMAKTVGAYLKTQGVRVYRLTNADHFGYDQTRITYQKGFYEEALRLRALLPGLSEKGGNLIEGDSGVLPVKLLLGKDLALAHFQTNPAASVEIANGNGTKGIARKLGGHFSSQGIRVAGMTDADHFNYPQTLVYYSGGQEGQARLIAEKLQGFCQVKLVKHETMGHPVKVILGSDMVF